ncbi:hypothetical protein PROFUN_06836 [Planoprotostelium fungivorum]|uniref:Uncharacterized protein n=1 Tax=Planoprotostelium fungivorum TaxID=1890364 RepID=A0A2P6NNE2_9EUKA|nr:hypothetical protein PROFUN_06836 [Planoprotostelium fungivorum]
MRSLKENEMKDNGRKPETAGANPTEIDACDSLGVNRTLIPFYAFVSCWDEIWKLQIPGNGQQPISIPYDFIPILGDKPTAAREAFSLYQQRQMQRLLTIIVLCLILCLEIQAQNTTSAPLPSCKLLNTGCSGRGVCQENGACRCFPGFVLPTVKRNGTLVKLRVYCNATISDGQPFMPPLIITLRTEIAVLNFVLLSLISYRLFLDFKLYGSKAHVITKISLIIIGLETLLLFINNAFDYWGTYGVLPPMCYFVFHALCDWLLIGVFCAIIFHWVNIYNSTVKSIRQQEMIKKINSTYSKPVSVEDIVRSVTFLRIFRLPYIAITGVTFIINLVRICVTPTWGSVDGYAIWYKFFNAWHLLLWGLFGIGFAVYGYRLMHVMPLAASKKIKRVTWKLCIVALLCTINALMMILLDSYQPVFSSLVPSVGLITRNFITFNVRTMVAAVVLDIHMPFTKMKTWFNGSAFSSTRNSSGKSGNIAQPQNFELATASTFETKV